MKVWTSTLTDVENPADRFAAMAGGQLDGLSTTLDTLRSTATRKRPSRRFSAWTSHPAVTASSPTPDITSVADLKGKKIGVNLGSVSQFLLEYVFKENGMTDAT